MYAPEEFQLHPARREDRPTIERLIQLYLYDMASDRPFAIGPEGIYDYGYLDAFWQHPYLILVADQIAGFALVIDRCPITGTSPCWFMAEFFVMRGFRRQSVGTTILHQVLSRHPGPWKIAAQTENEQADAFWARAIGSEVKDTGYVRFDDADWVVRSFEVKGEGRPGR